MKRNSVKVRLGSVLLAALGTALISVLALAQLEGPARAQESRDSKAGNKIDLEYSANFPTFGSDAGKDRVSRIVGGTAVTNSKYPFMARLQIETDRGTVGCGGTLIDQDSVLTAAHCMEGATSARALIGATVLTQGNQDQIRKVTDIFVHPNYDGRDFAYDSAVLKLAEPVNDIEPIALSSRQQDYLEEPGQTLTVAGWGVTESGAFNIQDRMREVSVPVVDDATALEAYASLSSLFRYYPSLMVAAGERGKSSCQGDSGGPLFATGADGAPVQVGIVSYAYGCASADYPTAYSEVNADEIRDQILADASR